MNVRTKKRIVITLGFVALLAMLTLVGGCEMGWMPVAKGMTLAALCEATGAALLYKGGVIKL